jgi:hypothetical protein
MKYSAVVFPLLLFTISTHAQDNPCLNVTLSKQTGIDSNVTNRKFIITIENVGDSPVQLLKQLTVNYEDDDHRWSNLYFVTAYWENTNGLTAFNHRQADIDFVPTRSAPELEWLKPKEKLSFSCNPFDYSGLIKGKKRYRVMGVYRIRKECGDVLYKSNYVDVEIE